MRLHLGQGDNMSGRSLRLRLYGGTKPRRWRVDGAEMARRRPWCVGKAHHADELALPTAKGIAFPIPIQMFLLARPICMLLKMGRNLINIAGRFSRNFPARRTKMMRMRILMVSSPSMPHNRSTTVHQFPFARLMCFCVFNGNGMSARHHGLKLRLAKVGFGQLKVYVHKLLQPLHERCKRRLRP